MWQSNKPDPYDGFKNDVDRRKALATRERWRYFTYMVVGVVTAIAGIQPMRQAVEQWLLK